MVNLPTPEGRSMKKVNVYPFINKGQFRNVPLGEIVGYVVDEGSVVVNGKKKRKRTQFKTEEEANAYAYKIDVAREAKAVNAVSDLGELMAMRSELMFCWDRLKTMGGTFTQAVDYFCTHYRSSKGDITVGDAMNLFKKTKLDQGHSQRYVDSLDRQHYPRFLTDFKSTQIINQITADQLREHFYHPRWSKVWGSTTRTNYIKNISALFSFLVKREYLTINHCLKVDKPKSIEKEIGYLQVLDVVTMLDMAAKYKWYDRICINTLVLFCGIRVEEACKMSWYHIHLDSKKVTVDAKIAKNRQRRINEIPENALMWLKLGYPQNPSLKREKIIPGNWEDKMSLLRRKCREKDSNWQYSHNAARHSFGTYHFALHKNPALTAVLLGHITDIKLLYKHYRGVETEEEAQAYFNIIPTEHTRKLLAEPIRTKQNSARFKKKPSLACPP